MKGYILFLKHVRKVIGKLNNCYYIVLLLIATMAIIKKNKIFLVSLKLKFYNELLNYKYYEFKPINYNQNKII